MAITITRSAEFDKDLKRLTPDLREAATKTLEILKEKPIPSEVHLHSTDADPDIFVADVIPNKTYQLLLRKVEDGFLVLGVAEHKDMDKYLKTMKR